MTSLAVQPLRMPEGSAPTTTNNLLPAIYEELHGLAKRLMDAERADHTLQPTALVHEAYLRLIREDRSVWDGPGHLFGSAARVLRRILVDHARRRSRTKRGGGLRRVPLRVGSMSEPVSDRQLLAVHEALEAFEGVDREKARLVELRFFGGLRVEEAAVVLGKSPSTVARDWRLARAWLRRRIELASDG